MLRHVPSMLVALLAISPFLSAGELLSEALPIEHVIDHYIEQQQNLKGIPHGPLADDSTLIRRTTLDLAGRIPLMEEARAYAASSESNKRGQLVDRLMSSPDFAYHFRNCLDGIVSNGQRNSPSEWRDYLLKATRQNRPWDQIFREMMIGDESNPEIKPALAFLRTRARDIDQLTNDVSSLFFGVNVSCAKCHDHPLVEDWKQDHYFGMSSFFHRTYVTKANLVAEKFSGDVKFKTTKGEDKVSKIMFLTGTIVDIPVVEKTPEQIKAENDEINRQTQNDNAGPPLKPEFSPRTKLVEVALHPENNRFFARNAVNRVWAMLLGRGLVHPLDQMHSANPASHPELLEWLSRDLIAHHYDLQRLVRGIVLSQAYARSSLWESVGDPPGQDLFCIATVRPLTAHQYAMSLRLASLNPETLSTATSPEWPGKREELERQADDLANQFESPGENFQIGVDEALFFSNGSKLWDDYVRDDNSTLIGCLKAKTDQAVQVETAFWTVLSRNPSPEERSACDEFLVQRQASALLGLRQFVWGLMTSPELRFNH